MKAALSFALLAAMLAGGTCLAQPPGTPPVEPARSGPVASVIGGKLRGSLMPSGVAVFKNIPFAQPPVGELRWREPVPAKWAADVQVEEAVREGRGGAGGQGGVASRIGRSAPLEQTPRSRRVP